MANAHHVSALGLDERSMQLHIMFLSARGVRGGSGGDALYCRERCDVWYFITNNSWSFRHYALCAVVLVASCIGVCCVLSTCDQRVCICVSSLGSKLTRFGTFCADPVGGRGHRICVGSWSTVRWRAPAVRTAAPPSAVPRARETERSSSHRRRRGGSHHRLPSGSFQSDPRTAPSRGLRS